METYDNIRDRLLHNVAGRYHCSPEELQPESRLFVDCMAWEMAALYREQRRSDDHIERHLWERLRPEKASRPLPAHAIAHARPKKQGVVLKAEEDLFTTNRLGSRPPHKIYFAPLLDTPLVNAQVKYLAASTKMKVCEDPVRTEKQLDALPGTSLHQSELWLGIAADAPFTDEQWCPFHFDWRGVGEERKQQLYDDLPLVKWHADDRVLSSQLGMKTCRAPSVEEHKRPLDTEQLFLHRLEQRILQVYNHRFVQVLLPPPSGLPERLSDVFGAENWATLEEQALCWVQLIFPAGFQAEEVEATSVTLNCFPILNRKLDKSQDFTPSHETEMLSLNSTDQGRRHRSEDGEYFLGIQQIFSKTAAYQPVTYQSLANAPRGVYALQRGRLEADDPRDLQDRIEELVGMIHKHASVLQLQGQQHINHALEQIKGGADKLDAALEKQPLHDQEPGYYLHLKVLDPREMVYVRFWVTQGREGAEVIKDGDFLKCNRDANVFNGGCLIVGRRNTG